MSQGLITYTGSGHERIGLISYSLPTLALAAAAGAFVWWAVRRGSSLWPLLLLVLVVVPWLTVPLPAVVLAWSGRVSLLVWLAIVAIMVASGPRRRPVPVSIRGPALAALLAFTIGAFAFNQVRGLLPAGDEPHYLVITQSLLKDGDLRIENNHRQGDYRAYFAGELPPDFRVRGRNREIYSIHAPGVPALIGPAFLLGGYRGVVVFLLLLSAAGSALAWHLARRVTGRDDAAWFGWATVTCSATWVFHSFAVFPDGAGAVAILGIAYEGA